MTTTNNKPSIIIVALFSCLLGFMGLFGSDLYLPAMPALQKSFSTSMAYIEWSVSIYMIGCGISPLLLGPLSDTYGRKVVVLTGLTIALAGTIMALFSTHITTFLIARIIQGIGSGAAFSMFRVMMRDVVSGKKMARLASYTTMIFNLSPVLGLMIGGYLVYYFNWQSCFLVLAISYILVIAVYAVFCPETIKHKQPFNVTLLLNNYMNIIRDYYLIVMAVCSGFAFSVLFAFGTSGAYIFQTQLHMSSIAFGWLGVLLSISTIVGKFINAQLIKYYSLKIVKLIGMLLVTISGILLLILPHTIVCVLIAILLSTTAIGLILSNAMSSGLQNHSKNIGYVASIFGSVQLLTVFVSNTILAHLYQFGIISLSCFYMIVGALSIIILIYVQRKRYVRTQNTILG